MNGTVAVGPIINRAAFTAEVEFRDITSDGLLRQSSYKRLSKRTAQVATRMIPNSESKGRLS
jgi:hypothetical protein